MMPAFAKPRRKVQLERIEALSAWAETCPYNQVVRRGDKVGVVCAGAVSQHVLEGLPDASVFKLGCTWPLPKKALRSFAESVDALYVVEEASCYLTDAVSALGIDVAAFPEPLPRDGELSVGLIRAAFGFPEPAHAAAQADVPGRPPALCPGCPHRLVFKELSRCKAIVTGDIGCYTLGALPPLSAMDTCVDMGASVSMAHGFELAFAGREHRPVVAVIGDSTFAHSGLSSLISTVYNKGAGTVCILDNRTTAMTGRQGNPFNGETLQHRPSRELDMEGVLKALGIEDVRTVDPHDARAVRRALKEATSATDTLSVIVFRAPCVLLERHREPAFEVSSQCTACGVCITLGCPAISKGEFNRPGAYRSRHVHRLRAVRAVLRTRLHRSGLGGDPMSSNTKTVLLCGVGGQGTILAADLLARAAEESGLDVKVSEIHGMAQRGGAVTTVVRFGDKVQSMIADLGSVDCVVSFETTEALRNLPYVKEGGSLFVNDESIKPLPVATGRASMPEHARERLRDAGAMLIPATELARKAGTTKAANVVLLGALSRALGFPTDVWNRVIAARVPEKYLDVNLEAFKLGASFSAE